MRGAERKPEAPAQQASDAVNIMTIHAAKGLEFSVVFVSALQGGRKNSTRRCCCFRRSWDWA